MRDWVRGRRERRVRIAYVGGGKMLAMEMYLCGRDRCSVNERY